MGLSSVKPIPHAIGTCTTERVDGHGRVIDQELRNRQPGEAELEHIRLFSYYRADGVVSRIVRAKSQPNTLRPEFGALGGLEQFVERTFAFDTVGRRIGTSDPDTNGPGGASWRYLFNEVSDLIAVRDPRGCGQNFFYDLAGRLTGEQYVSCQEAAPPASLATEQVPAGSVGMGRVATAVPVQVRYHFDVRPEWALGMGVPADAAGTLGRATGTSDLAQRSAIATDRRGNVIWSGTQLALLAQPGSLRVSGSGPAPVVEAGAPTPAPQVYDVHHTYVTTTEYDHADRVIRRTLPLDPDYPSGQVPLSVGGAVRYRADGAPQGTDLLLDGHARPVVANLQYTRDGLVSRATYGDAGATGSGSAATFSETWYHPTRRWPERMRTVRSVAEDAREGTLGAVATVVDQRLAWDEVDNLIEVQDLRDGSQWPEGHRPQSSHVDHDALYRVTGVGFSYGQPDGSSGLDVARDWRDTHAAHRDADPLAEGAAPMVARMPGERVADLQYRYDWLANMQAWDDDAHSFYERSVGTIVNGADLNQAGASGLRPSALYLASNLDRTTAGDLGGFLSIDFGAGGNMASMTVRAQCVDVAEGSCVDPGGSDVQGRVAALADGCQCAEAQHYRYAWDPLNRLASAARFDQHAGGNWQVGARQHYLYDGANQRRVKSVVDPAGEQRACLVVAPGDVERRGLTVSPGADAYEPAAGGKTETQYLVSGARVVVQDSRPPPGVFRPDYRVTFSVTNLIQSTSAVVDLVSGALLEVSTYYPNGARESWLSAAHDAAVEANWALEPAGFTGKEADTEVGVVYFGERYLVPRIGRWASPDPLAVHAVGGGESLNSYHYVAGNLLQARDPWGLDPNQSMPGAPMSVDPDQAADVDAGYANQSVGANSSGSQGAQSDGDAWAVPSAAEMDAARSQGRTEALKNAVKGIAVGGVLALVGAAIAGPPGAVAGGLMLLEGDTPPATQAPHPDSVEGAQAQGQAQVEAALTIGSVALGALGTRARASSRAPAKNPQAQQASRGRTHGHHSDPKFMGRKKKQGLTNLPEATHKQLHKHMNDFLRQRQDAMGNHIRPQRGNSGARIRGNFTRGERLEALGDFYRQNASRYPDAARDFFKQHPNL